MAVFLKRTDFYKLAKRLKLGSLIYRFYYAPKSFFERIFSKGIVNSLIDEHQKSNMQRAAYNLEPITNNQVNSNDLLNQQLLEIYFLTGKKFWYQTCFCAYSMSTQSKEYRLSPVIYDDGSLSHEYQNEIIRIFPNAKINLKSEIDECINKHLPRSKFPYLRERRDNYPNIRKLTDIHVGNHGWKLILDSDMLFFKPPTVIIDWIRNPTQPCYMLDVQTSYGYSQALMDSLAKTTVPERINVGICGLKSEDIDWDEIEFWCKTMIEQQGTSYYQEQAIIAMIMARQTCTVVSDSDYIVMPKREEVIHPKAILHHYVSDSKSWYFRYGWKQVGK
ncbi:glycosyl transferase [Pseudanabaena sp. FACHB-1998]|uniref:glycosyl transferase n=1 Tax=Pseudanabaena sp. FACHB-1998 TaxID=2692858 RepID=UPI0016817206|nr:glycosyl transferase [Pseudanabaena sp. FACHB-1998]MBD2176622.1 glycosyl transferase [Pseudanabaena sp. FACHB-1998]